MNLTDTHCHLDLDKFEEDRNAVLERARAAGLYRILIPGLNLSSSQRVLALANSYPDLFCAIGIHPSDSLGWDANTKENLKKLYGESASSAQSNPNQTKKPLKIVAIGEIGLDYYWDDTHHKHQQMVLMEQLALAEECNIPVVIHMREKEDALEGDCSRDMTAILENWVQNLRDSKNSLAKAPGVLHSFSGNALTAEKLLDLNFFIGITGPVTYKNAQQRRQVVKSLPLEHILIETDAPFLAPEPKRGRRNEPAFVRYIADKIAEIHNKDPEEVARITTKNSDRLFSWGG